MLEYDARALGLERERFADSALQLVYRLVKAGHEAYIVGGSIRDFLIGKTPKDFDIATSAYPKQIVRLFPRSRIIGMRFKIVHVYLDDEEILEVTTFRSLRSGKGKASTSSRHRGRKPIVRDNLYGTLEEDVLRRDFTVNAMYYSPVEQRVVAYKHAMRDLEERQLKCIGKIEQSYTEDPVRMLRALRYVAKTGFTLAQDETRLITQMTNGLKTVTPGRLFEEVSKLFQCGSSEAFFALLEQHGLAKVLFPLCYRTTDAKSIKPNFLKAFAVLADAKTSKGEGVSRSLIAATLLWIGLPPKMRLLFEDENSNREELRQAIYYAVRDKLAYPVAIPSCFVPKTMSVCVLQICFTSKRFVDLKCLLSHRYFNEAYDFFCLRASIGSVDKACASWWAHLLKQTKKEQMALLTKHSVPEERRPTKKKWPRGRNK
ncbi:MAG: polynucleotide adenylyltransferase PcnB [Candidatus Oxydemutatoraceae bacterium WSBS_2016_MAG_OTU14]